VKGPLPWFLLPLMVPASRIYGGIIAHRNARFDRGQGVERIDRPVISVGNLTTGGVGKSPMVAWIARQLMEQRCEPVITMRGYGARGGEMSDEQAEYRELLPEVHVVAHANRAAALRKYLPEHRDVKCVILDDGFQHRQLHRDLDLVLIDATANTFNDRLLPAGNLREPVMSLRRADAVIVTHAKSIDNDLARLIEKHHGNPPIAWTRHRWTHLDVFDHEASANPEEVSWLDDKRVLTLLGVGKPESVIRQLKAQGAKVITSVPAGDHERFARSKLARVRGLCDGCGALVVTGKDWVKIRSLIDVKAWPVPIVVPRLAIEFLAGEQDVRGRIGHVVRGVVAEPDGARRSVAR
jgi:tetraacyldisaccharide 4'-kinase